MPPEKRRVRAADGIEPLDDFGDDDGDDFGDDFVRGGVTAHGWTRWVALVVAVAMLAPILIGLGLIILGLFD